VCSKKTRGATTTPPRPRLRPCARAHSRSVGEHHLCGLLVLQLPPLLLPYFSPLLLSHFSHPPLLLSCHHPPPHRQHTCSLCPRSYPCSVTS
jgi:hypothetical protein